MPLYVFVRTVVAFVVIVAAAVALLLLAVAAAAEAASAAVFGGLRCCTSIFCCCCCCCCFCCCHKQHEAMAKRTAKRNGNKKNLMNMSKTCEKAGPALPPPPLSISLFLSLTVFLPLPRCTPSLLPQFLSFSADHAASCCCCFCCCWIGGIFRAAAAAAGADFRRRCRCRCHCHCRSCCYCKRLHFITQIFVFVFPSNGAGGETGGRGEVGRGFFNFF